MIVVDGIEHIHNPGINSHFVLIWNATQHVGKLSAVLSGLSIGSGLFSDSLWSAIGFADKLTIELLVRFRPWIGCVYLVPAGKLVVYPLHEDLMAATMAKVAVAAIVYIHQGEGFVETGITF